MLRRIPSVDELVTAPRLTDLAKRVNRTLVVETARSVLARLRARATKENKGAEGNFSSADLSDQLITEIISEIEQLLQPSLRPVINATGVVLHTNLGRAPLAAEAVERIRAAATQYSNLEYDLETGARGTRDVHTARLLARLAGAESAIVVNNNAAAVFLVLAALARGGEVIVSRGELIEIGDGFRIPDIMAESGAALREVGTTNRTRLLLRVHRSNFSMAGFTAQPSLAELVELGRRVSLPVYEDLGSGCLVDLSISGIEEPLVGDSFAAGVSIASFSGDKLLGGPQAGVIAGNRDLVARIRRHPLFRALRVDKLTIAALEATLLAYLREPDTAAGHSSIPTLKMIRTTAAEIAMRAEKFLQVVRATVPANLARFELRAAESVVGGGSTPGQELPTRAIAVHSAKYSATELELRLRRAPLGIPVIARVEDGSLLLDIRTVFPEQEPLLAESLAAALAS